MFPSLNQIDEAEAGGLLQVLLHDLEVERGEEGLTFSLRLDGREPALRSGADKRRAAAIQNFEEGKRVAAAIDALRTEAAPGSRRHFRFRDFRPRHASAGAWVRLLGSAPDASDEILLVHRDIDPVGWNLINGASASRRELSVVEEVLMRECAEELLFAGEDLRLHGLALPETAPEALAARAAWRARGFAAATGMRNAAETLPLRREFVAGPDRLRVIEADGRETLTEGLWCSLQIEDFGLECLRELRIHDAAALRPLDGEMGGGRLLDRRMAQFSSAALAAEFPRPRVSFREGRALSEDPPQIPLCPVVRRMYALSSPR
jgi:hypothetical protein